MLLFLFSCISMYMKSLYINFCCSWYWCFYIFWLIGPNVEPTSIESSAKCSTSSSISFWHVCSTYEKYLPVERNSRIANFRRTCSWCAFMWKGSTSCAKHCSKCPWCDHEDWKDCCFFIWGLGRAKRHRGSQVWIMIFLCMTTTFSAFIYSHF